MSVDLYYGLSGYYDEEAGYYLWAGDIGSMIGEEGDYYYQDVDRPMDLSYSATLTPGQSAAGYYELNDHNDGTFIRVDFNVALFSAAGIFSGTSGTDIVFGSDEADSLEGFDGDDFLEGGAGTDSLYGHAGVDTLYGGAGDDYLDGGAGKDILYGGAGDDHYIVDDSNDRVIEAKGEGSKDHVFSSVSFNLRGQHIEFLTLTGTANINATGQSMRNTITGNSGDNRIDGGIGHDLMIGKGGNDTYIVDAFKDRVIEAKGEGDNDHVFASVSFSLRGQHIERLTLTGNGDINATGQSLANTIVGNVGDNLIAGGSNTDTLTGGGGRDTFVFDTAFSRYNVDTITDFAADDTISLDRDIFTALSLGTLANSRFVASTAGVALDGNDRIMLQTTTGKLFYDRDGTGNAAAIHFATLANGATATAADFIIVA
ncbi:calcium-binding protein [Ensifer soli]|uniref:calcium-binding protein n=1 Tax=Ciceribacter sp. sgz301302 TaxID=3342379 RepID=UPI0035BAC64E